LTPPADFSGVWRGEYRVASCSGERHCELQIGTAQPFILRVAQIHAEIKAVLEIPGWFAVDIHGTVTKDGAVSLSGQASAPTQEGTDVDVKHVELALDPAGQLTGTLAYHTATHRTYSEGTFESNREGRIESARRTSLDNNSRADYTGLWRGWYVVRACTQVGWAACYPDEAGEVLSFELQLSQRDTEVSGELQLASRRVPVTGRVGKDGLTLTGLRTEAVSGGQHHTRLLQFSASDDGFERLPGTFQFSEEFVDDAGPVRSSSYHAETWQVTRRQ
jgi:hypothetical protein